MKIKDFFKNTKKTLGIKVPKEEDVNKQKRLEELIEKLKQNKIKIREELKLNNISDERKSEIEEELHVYKLQIQKGEKILEKKKE